MYSSESIHRYPRQITASIELLCALLVALPIANLAASVLRGIWDIYGRDETLIGRVPFLSQIVAWIDGGARVRSDNWVELLFSLLPALGWAAAALLVAILLRSALPAVRASSRGLLVEFAGSWVPVPWEGLRSVKVTSDVSGSRFVLLAETSPRQLTGWHRLYSLLYGRGWRPGFYITSTISEFDPLLKTIIEEGERTARSVEGVRPLRIEEDAPSPVFRLLLSPAAFFSRQAAGDTAASAVTLGAPALSGGPVRALYPNRITALVGGATLVLVAFAAWRYLSYWVRALALLFPGLRTVPPFSWTYTNPEYVELYNAYRTSGVPFFGVPGFAHLPSPFWLLVAAHLMLLFTAFFVIWLRDLLPALESRDDGMAIRAAGRWRVVPWGQIRAFKASELSEQSQVLLLQAPGLPASQALTSALYDGSAAPGALITSAIGNYQALLQHALARLVPLDQARETPALQQEARSPLLYLAFRRREALADLAAQIKSEESTRRADVPTLLRLAGPMIGIAALPALMLLADRLLDGDGYPSLGIILGALVIWFFGVLEWPLVAIVSLLIDDNTGGGEEGYRALYVYPSSQLPRLLPLVAALAFQVVGAPALPALLWIAAIVWAFWLAAGLFEQLYEWQGTQAILGGVLPVVWQLLLLFGFLLATR